MCLFNFTVMFIIFSGNIIDHIDKGPRNDTEISIWLFRSSKGQRQSQFEASIEADAKCYYSLFYNRLICRIFSCLYFECGMLLLYSC